MDAPPFQGSGRLADPRAGVPARVRGRGDGAKGVGDRRMMNEAHLWLLLGSVATAAFLASLVLLFVPSELRDPMLRGYRATRRREALEGSALLKLAWPLIRLCTYYAQIIPAP